MVLPAAIRTLAIRPLSAWLAGLLACAVFCCQPLGIARAGILSSQVASTNTYAATATITVDTPDPSSFNLSNLVSPFSFTGTHTYQFNVLGNITILNQAPTASFTDLITGTSYTAPGGLSALQQEIVSLVATSFSSQVGSNVTAVTVGDGVADGVNSGAQPGQPQSLFSTGGAVENSPSGATAAGFLNLFLEINVQNPLIPIPTALQATGLAASYTIGNIYNQTPLQLQATISTYPPLGVQFTVAPSTTVAVYEPVTSQFVQDLHTDLHRPLVPLEVAQFTVANLAIVPEPSGGWLAGMAAAMLAGAIWQTRRRRTRGALPACPQATAGLCSTSNSR